VLVAPTAQLARGAAGVRACWPAQHACSKQRPGHLRPWRAPSADLPLWRYGCCLPPQPLPRPRRSMHRCCCALRRGNPTTGAHWRYKRGSRGRLRRNSASEGNRCSAKKVGPAVSGLRQDYTASAQHSRLQGFAQRCALCRDCLRCRPIRAPSQGKQSVRPRTPYAGHSASTAPVLLVRLHHCRTLQHRSACWSSNMPIAPRPQRATLHTAAGQCRRPTAPRLGLHAMPQVLGEGPTKPAAAGVGLCRMMSACRGCQRPPLHSSHRAGPGSPAAEPPALDTADIFQTSARARPASRTPGPRDCGKPCSPKPASKPPKPPRPRPSPPP